jgi:hypothetical protein
MSAGVAAGAGVAASMLITAYAGAQQSLNEAKLLKSQNAARIKKMNQQFAFDTQNMYNNEVSLKQQRFKNDVLIEENKLEAQDAFSQAFAGSGVSGRSVDALEAQISGDVAKAHNENKEATSQQQDRQFLGLMRTGQSNTQAIKDMVSFDFGAAKAANDMATLSAGIQSAASNASAFAG